MSATLAATLLTPPLEEPVSLIDIKAYLKIEHNDEDAMLRGFLTAARSHLEQLTGRHFISQTWRIILEAPLKTPFALPCQPLQSITAAAILNKAGDLVSLDASAFKPHRPSDPAMITHLGSARLLKGQRLQLDCQIGFGPTPEDVPAPLRQALKMIVAEWFERRLVADPTQLPSLNRAIQPLVAPYKTVRL